MTPIRYREWIAIFVLIIIIVAVLAYQVVGWRDCSDRGGKWVASIAHMECVDTRVD